MPIYEYKCKKCGNINEFLVKNSKNIDLNCPDCASKELEKQISVPGGLITKGSSPNPDMPCSSSQCQTNPMCGAASKRCLN